jgi:hypothetical protein
MPIVGQVAPESQLQKLDGITKSVDLGKKTFYLAGKNIPVGMEVV